MSKSIIPVTQITHSIYFLRGQKLMLDFDLATLYGVTTGHLNRAVKRNANRFPSDFMFQLNAKEVESLICQFGISSWGGLRTRPYAFTEQGVAMLSSVLKNERAVKVNIAIMRAFFGARALPRIHATMIAWTIYVTFAGAVLVLLLPRVLARWIALITTAAGLAISAIAFFNAGDFGTFKTIVRIPWVPLLGMEYHLAADGISLTLALVTGLTALSAVLFSWDVEDRPNEFFFWLLLVVGGSYGVFFSADLFLLFLFYELVIVPKYFLIAIWGSTNKEYGAMKLTLYSFFGGALVFIGIIAVYVTAGKGNAASALDLQQLAQFPFAPQFQSWAFPVLFLGFAVLAGIWPLHTWAPTGHVAAPTAGSMLLAGIVMKLGAYGGLRVALNLFPQGFHMWSKWIAVLGIIGIVYAAAVALRQRDLKFVIGYSSVSHMGFVLLGLATANALGVGGAVLQMFSHGVIAALLFAVAGRMVYRRTHTRDLDELSGMALSRAMPFAAFSFVIASAASMGIPGFSGFAAEITILIGVWKAYPIAVWIVGAGMVLVAAFTLRALRKTFFGDKNHGGVYTQQGRVPVDSDWNEEQEIANRITLAEKCGAGLLMFATIAVGLYPKLLLDRILPAVEAMRFLK